MQINVDQHLVSDSSEDDKLPDLESPIDLSNGPRKIVLNDNG